MNCPKCNTEILETVEERWSGKYNNVLGVIVFYDCLNCGYRTDTTEDEGLSLHEQARKSLSQPTPAQTGSAASGEAAEYIDIWKLLKNYVREYETANNEKFSNSAWQRIKQLETDTRKTMSSDVDYQINLQTEGKASNPNQLSVLVDGLQTELTRLRSELEAKVAEANGYKAELETLRHATNPLVQYIRALSEVSVREVSIIGGENMARELVEKSTELLVDYNSELGNAVIYMPKVTLQPVRADVSGEG